MYENISLSEVPPSEELSGHQRVAASASASFKHSGGKTRLDRLYQQGSAKIRFPRTHAAGLEAVLVNTAGGLTGGDQLTWELEVGENGHATASTQACEKAYRSPGDMAHLNTRIDIGNKASLHWLPQETILYDGSSLGRTLEVSMAENASLLAVESIVLGRIAMGEKTVSCHFRDRWRIRKGNRLVFADDLNLHGREMSLAGMNGCNAVATLLFISGQDADQAEHAARKLRQICPLDKAGFSAVEDRITGRIITGDSYRLRQALIPVIEHLRGTCMPRVWGI